MLEKSTIIAIVLAVLAWSGLLLTASPREVASTGSSALPPLLEAAEFTHEAVESITLAKKGEAQVVFRRTNGSWQQTQPIAHPVDQFSIQQLVELVRELRVWQQWKHDRLPEGVTLESLQLADPPATLTYAWPDGSLKLLLGRRGVGGRAYVRVDGREHVEIVNPQLHERVLDGDPREWRDRTLFTDVSADVQRIEIAYPDATLELVREGKLWSMTSPVRTRADGPAIEELIASLGRARSSGFVIDQPADLSRFGLDHPAARLTVHETRGGQAVSQSLLIGTAASVSGEDRFGMIDGRPAVVRVGPAVLAALFMPRNRLASPIASGVMAADVKSIRIMGPGGDFRLQRDLERWLASDHGGTGVPAQQAQELLEQLTVLRAPSVLFQPYPADMNVAVVTLHGYDGKPRDSVRIARDPKSGNWVLENGDNVLRVHPASMTMRLSPADFGLAAQQQGR